MGALNDISCALSRCREVKRGSERVILVSISAARAIQADMLATDDKRDLWDCRINGVCLRMADHFDGWDIADVDRDGRWTSVDPIESSEQKA
jgi:hypothetical protein